MKPCAVIPHYEHARTVCAVLDAVAAAGLPAIVVDDGSGEQARAVLAEYASGRDAVEVVFTSPNGGKGQALKAAFTRALERGFTHALQIDADGQHDTRDIPEFLSAMRSNPLAVVLGDPIFDEQAPRARLLGRQLSRAMVWLVTCSRVVNDPLCGFRGVPLQAAVDIIRRQRTGDRMDFDPEMAVRLVWAGVPVIEVRTRISYPAEGGTSHFRMFRDNVLLSRLYAGLLGKMLLDRLLATRRSPTGEERG